MNLAFERPELLLAIPVLWLLYDRAFLAGSFGRALRERRGLYAGLFSCWLLLAALVILR